MKRRAFLSALFALPVAPLAVKGLAQEPPKPEPDFPEGYRTYVWKADGIYAQRVDLAEYLEVAERRINRDLRKLAANV